MDETLISASPDIFVDGVASKDVKLQTSYHLWARIFLPQNAKGLPIVLYCHGGAYCYGDPVEYSFHDFCHRMAAKSQAIWVSLAYRLSPSHKLPTVYDDGFAALQWLQSQASLQTSGDVDPWLQKESADFSKCFLAGDSAGATVSLSVALKAASLELVPLRLHDLVLVHPGFHSEASRHSMGDEGFHFFHHYDIALNEGQNLDHFPINPLAPRAPSLAPLAVYPNILVACAEKDFRCEMTLKFCEVLTGFCESVQVVFTQGKDHIFHFYEPGSKEAADLETDIIDFICSSST